MQKVSHHVANLTMWMVGVGGLGFAKAPHHVANLPDV